MKTTKILFFCAFFISIILPQTAFSATSSPTSSEVPAITLKQKEGKSLRKAIRKTIKKARKDIKQLKKQVKEQASASNLLLAALVGLALMGLGYLLSIGLLVTVGYVVVIVALVLWILQLLGVI